MRALRVVVSGLVVVVGCGAQVVAPLDGGLVGTDVIGLDVRGPDAVAPDTMTSMDASLDAQAPAPCSVDANGLPCDPPGTGCGGGGGACDPSFVCSCRADRRWHCEVTRPMCVDAGRDVSMPPVDAATCSIVGTFRAEFMGASVLFRFNPDGSWVAGQTQAELDTMPIPLGTYTTTGTTLRVVAGSEDMGCMPGDVGTYTMIFDAGCVSLDLRVIRDACLGRRTALDMAIFTRL